MQRKQFTFYASYLEAARMLGQKDCAVFLAAICDYALNETLPEDLAPAAQAAFLLARPTLDAGRKRAQRRLTPKEQDA